MLESRCKHKYGSEYDLALLEQWKTFVETAERNTEKRSNANNLFIALNSALLAIVTFTGEYKSLIFSVIGIIICNLWIKSIQSYKQLSDVKYGIINEMETKLPLSPFTYEWELLNKRNTYAGLTKIEMILPKVFIAVYALALLLPVLKYFISVICPLANIGA